MFACSKKIIITINIDIFCCSCISFQLDWISFANVCLSHCCWTLWCACWIWTVSSQMDFDCQTFHGLGVQWQQLAVVANYGFWWVNLSNEVIVIRYNVHFSGVLICVRAVIQYLCIKREWHRLSRAAQERVVFFY